MTEETHTSFIFTTCDIFVAASATATEALVLYTGVAACTMAPTNNGLMQTFKVPGGQEADLWSGVNVRGKVHYLVRTRDGSDQIPMWWITWGTGSVEQLGMRKADGSLDIPSGFGVLSSKLRCSASVDTVVFISDTVSVDHSRTFAW